MNLLLDTHVIVWAEEGSLRLGPKTREILRSSGNSLHYSPISGLELARLASLNRIEFRKPLTEWFAGAISHLGLIEAPLELPEAVESYQLPGEFHRDPADRVLTASARLGDLTLVTADKQILAYSHVKTHDART